MFNYKWEEKQRTNLSGQTGCVEGIQGTHVGNMILQSPPGFSDKDFLAGSTINRNLTPLASFRSTPECSIPRQYLQENNRGPVSFRHQLDSQTHRQNHLSETRPTFNENLYSNGIGKTGNTSHNMVAHLQTMPDSATCKQTDNVVSQTEAHRSLPSLKSFSTDTGKSLVGSSLQELLNFVATAHGLPLKMPLELEPSEYTRLVEILQQSSGQPNQSSSHSTLGGATIFPSLELASSGLSVSTQQDGINGTMQNGEETIKVKEMTMAPITEKPKLAVTIDEKSTSKNNQEKIVGHGQKNDPSRDHFKIDEKKLPSEKAACIVAEKLWDGSLQLSSSVTLSAVAFFKSGEKLLDNIWPEFIEVKGKVRLEAFEKYIQDLPRSRNRGLMVISLCWKEGSSETGLTGMKEVTKGYKKSSRVGFAQVSPGIDLYICPRSDPIITILAKYGFFKGMAVIDDNQDSMIGCVVWRKNRSSNPVANKPDDKNSPNSIQPQNSPTTSSINQDAEKLSPIKPQEPSQPIVPASVNCESSRENCTENKNTVTSEVDPNVKVNSTVTSDPCNLVKKRRFEDDDLPEFDFGAASQPLNLAISKNHGLPLVNGPKIDNSRLTQFSSIMKQTSEPHALVLEGKNNVSRNTNTTFVESSKRTKLFDDDDDDMPEWCPPELHKQIPPQTTHLPSCPPRPPLPILPPPPAATPLSFRPFRPLMSHPSVRPPPLPPFPFQRDSSSSVGSNFGQTLRHHQNSSNVNPLFPVFNGRRAGP